MIVPAVVPVWNAMLDSPPMVVEVAPMATFTVATRKGLDRNWIAASSVTPATLDWNAMVSVPLPVTWEAEVSGIVMLFCCALAPTLEAKTMDAPGRGGSSPWPVSVNARWSTVRAPWESVPDWGVNLT